MKSEIRQKLRAKLKILCSLLEKNSCTNLESFIASRGKNVKNFVQSSQNSRLNVTTTMQK
jgi:hypothetical protein